MRRKLGLGRMPFVAAIVLGAAGTGLAQGPGPAPVAAATVIEKAVAAEQTMVGTVMPVRQSVVGSAVDGRVLEFLVNEGDHVEKDQPLAQLRTDTLEIELAAARAQAALAEHELAELKNGTRPEEIQQAKARMEAAKALASYRQSRRKRMEELASQKAMSEDSLQDSTSAARAAEELFSESKIAWQLAVTGPRQEKVAQAQAKVDAAREEVHRLQNIIKKHTIVAPFDGYVVAEHTETGQWLARAALVAEVAELSRVDVQIHVLETYVPQLKVGQSARVEIEALPDLALTGSVALVNPRGDVRSRTFPVKVRLKNREDGGSPLLKAGMLAQVSLALGKPALATLVPKDALVLGGPAPVVFAVDGSPGQPAKVRAVPVQLGVVHEGLIQVKGNLKAGQQVVVQGNERLRDGQAVLVQRPARASSAAAPRSAAR